MLGVTAVYGYIMLSQFTSPGKFTNLHAQPHRERIQEVTWIWMMSEPSLVAVFLSSVRWSSSSSSRFRRRLILSSVKHYKGTKRKDLKFQPPWKVIDNDVPRWYKAKIMKKMTNTKTILFTGEDLLSSTGSGITQKLSELPWICWLRKGQCSWNYHIFS